MKYFIAVLALVLALPAAAVAMPVTSDPIAPDQKSSSTVNARGTDVAAADQQSPKPSPVNARGTDVSAPDQQSPLVRVVEVPASVPQSGFDWTDALIGAVAALALLS